MGQVVVGLDIGSRSVRVARLRVGFRTLELEQLVVRPIEQDPLAGVAELAAGADMLFSAVSGDLVSVRRLVLPGAAAKRIEQIVPFELDGDIPFDVQEMVFDHSVVSQSQEAIDVLVAAAKRVAVERHLSDLGAAGLNPREVGAGALVYAELGRHLAPTGVVAVVDVGARSTDICIVSHGNATAARTISVGGRDVTLALSKAFGVPEVVAEEWKRAERYLTNWEIDGLDGEQRVAAEAVRDAVSLLVRDVRQTLAAHAMTGGKEVERVVLCGGGSRLAGLDEHLAANLGLEVVPLALPAAIGAPEEVDLAAGSKALALALRGAALRGRRIDLRKGELAFAAEAHSGRGLFLYALAIVAAVMLAWGFSAYGRRVSLLHQQTSQYQELAVLSERLLGERLDTFAELRRLLARAEQHRGDDSPLGTGDAFDVVEQISARIPAEINHEIDVLDIRPGRTQIQGRVDQRRDADLIESALSGWDACFSKVQVTRTTPAVREKRLQYTMDIESRCP